MGKGNEPIPFLRKRKYDDSNHRKKQGLEIFLVNIALIG